MTGFANRYLTFLHSFQQSRLHLRWRAVDFISQYNIAKNRTAFSLKSSGFLIINHRSDQISRQKVRCELDAAKIDLDNFSQCANS